MDPRSYKFRIHRFVDQSARHERSGGLSTAKIHDFPARVFSDRYQNAHIPIFNLAIINLVSLAVPWEVNSLEEDLQRMK